MKQQLINFYLDWMNNLFSIEQMAEDYSLTVEQIIDLVSLSRAVYEDNLKEPTGDLIVDMHYWTTKGE